MGVSGRKKSEVNAIKKILLLYFIKVITSKSDCLNTKIKLSKFNIKQYSKS